MNKYVNRKSKIGGDGERDDDGFTLVEILIAIVLIGILSAVVVVGISNLTDKGNSSACVASADAAKTGAIVYFATENPEASAYPTSLDQMVNSTPPALQLPSGVDLVPGEDGGPSMQAKASGWTLTMKISDNGGPPTFSCKNT
jgi:prepilin-type N-terminal cleavage/methylation domain-containing protein